MKEKLLKGYKVGQKTFKVHLDGYNLLPYLKGEKESPRKEVLYWSDDGDLMALRYGNWKARLQEQRKGGFEVWSEPIVDLRVPKIFNLRSDPSSAQSRLDLLLRTGCCAGCSCSCRRRAIVGAVDLQLPGLPAGPEAGELQHRSGDGEARGRCAEEPLDGRCARKSLSTGAAQAPVDDRLFRAVRGT